MKNLKKALVEELGVNIKRKGAKRCFNKVYSFLLYQDTASLCETLDYRKTLNQNQKPREHYYVFRHMLRLIKTRHPKQYDTLCL